jgi:hypothetical protein
MFGKAINGILMRALAYYMKKKNGITMVLIPIKYLPMPHLF